MMNRLDADQVAAHAPEIHAPRGHAYYAHLRRRLRWQLLFVYVTPLLLLSAYLLLQHGAVLRGGIESHLRAVAENQRNTVDLFLEERVANLRSTFLTDFPNLPAEIPANLNRVLAGLRRESTTFVDVGLFDPAGTLVAYAGPYPTLLGKSYREEEWYERLLAQERGYHISDVYLGFRGAPHFIIAVRRPVGEQTWVLRASVDPERFSAFVGSSHLIAEAKAAVINAAGQPQTAGGAAQAAGAAGAPPPRSEQTAVLVTAASGRAHVSAYAWLQEVDWALVVSVPQDVAHAPLRRARLTALAIMLGALLLIIAFVQRSTRRLVGRLEAADAAQSDLQRQLFSAAKLASVGEMAAGVAHEINNPLAIIYEEVGLMKDTLDPEFGLHFDGEEFRERLQVVADAAMRGRAVTSKLLAFARRHDPDPQPEDINRICERVLAMKAVEFNVSNITVAREFADDLPPVLVNENQLEQVLLNLLNNARDAIDGAGTITVRTLPQERTVVVEIADTGCGMTTEQMEKIFFPFYTTKGVGKGTGLGLSISYGIVKAWGGRLEVQSELGVGSTFSVLLPAARPGAASGPSPSATRGKHE